MTNNKRILGLLGLSSRARNITAGSDVTEQEIKKEKIKLIIVAEDASDRTKKKFTELSIEFQIPIIIFGTIEEISKAIGKQNKAIIGIKDINISNEMQKINRGDVNG